MTDCGRLRSLIVRSVDGDLEPGEAFRLARHLTTCTACRIVLARESRLAQMLDGASDTVSVDESFFETVMASLPDRPVPRALESSRETRRKRGIRLATLGALLALGGGLAARVLPSLQFDVAAPAMPRFSPGESEGFFTVLGLAAQWIRMTANSAVWAGSSGSWGALAMGALSLSAVLAALATLITVSGAVAWASRPDSRAS